MLLGRKCAEQVNSRIDPPRGPMNMFNSLRQTVTGKRKGGVIYVCALHAHVRVCA